MVKKSKINTFNYYFNYPMMIITLHEGLSRNIKSKEIIEVQAKLLDFLKYKAKAKELLKTK